MKYVINLIINVCLAVLIGIAIEIIVYRCVTMTDINLNELVGYKYLLQVLYVVLLILYGVKYSLKKQFTKLKRYTQGMYLEDGRYLLEFKDDHGNKYYCEASCQNSNFALQTFYVSKQIHRYQKIKTKTNN